MLAGGLSINPAIEAGNVVQNVRTLTFAQRDSHPRKIQLTTVIIYGTEVEYRQDTRRYLIVILPDWGVPGRFVHLSAEASGDRSIQCS
jgi:hypothetical protein